MLGLYRVAVVWKDGRKSEVDLAPQILRYAVYRPLRENPDAFKRAEIVEGGVAVAWPGPGVDISADAIAALGRSQTMTPEEFRARLKRLGLSFDAAAATFAISRRQIAYYSAGAKPVPRHVVLALSGFEAELGGASLEVRVPNAATRAAMAEARKGKAKLPGFKSARALVKSI